jgi:outer membrane protein insertion porin family
LRSSGGISGNLFGTGQRVKLKKLAVRNLVWTILPALAAGMLPVAARGQAAAPATAPAITSPANDLLKGRTVEDVRIIGNNSVSTASIRNLIRTHEGDKFDPATVEEDYQRVYGLRKFANVEPKVEPTATGVIVIFQITEQKQIRQITFQGNTALENTTLADAIDIKVGESIDRFRINLARQSIERLYKDKNYPFAQVVVPPDPLSKGNLVFNITQGPNVRVRRVQILGNQSFSDDKLKDQIKTRHWIWIFRAGTYDPDQIEDDVASLRQWYDQHGFFDARVGRKIIWSPDQSEVMVTFVIDEGAHYKIDKVTFKGNSAVSEAELRKNMKVLEGRYYDVDGLRRDVRTVVRAYSKYGFIYQPAETDPRKQKDYLQINPQPILRREAGTVGLVYDINEGKPFTIGSIFVHGNSTVAEKVFLRELRVAPGQLYNSGELLDAADRIRSTRLVDNQGVTITPIGDDPNTRDLLVEVKETQTIFFLVGAGVTSNSGILGNISYEQRNFDITNVPSSLDELFSRRAFRGAGEYFRILLEPGTEQTRARITFEEPWLFDQPYNFRSDVYYSTREREHWFETRTGLTETVGHRFTNEFSLSGTIRAEDIFIHAITDAFHRAPEIDAAKGHSTLTSFGLTARYDTTDSRILPTRGVIANAVYEYAGAFGGDYDFHKLTLGYTYFQTVNEDLLERKTILTYRADAGYITGNAPFFERFYAGGLGSVRGFAYRGISPRSGPEEDPIGGKFSLSGSMELNFPIAGEALRGVVFADAGTVEPDFRLGTIRSSVGFGVRLTLPIFGQLPLALDFGIPITKDRQDDTRFISFSLGFVQ